MDPGTYIRPTLTYHIVFASMDRLYSTESMLIHTIFKGGRYQGSIREGERDDGRKDMVVVEEVGVSNLTITTPLDELEAVNDHDTGNCFL